MNVMGGGYPGLRGLYGFKAGVMNNLVVLSAETEGPGKEQVWVEVMPLILLAWVPNSPVKRQILEERHSSLTASL